MSNRDLQKDSGKDVEQQQGRWTWVPQDEDLEHNLEMHAASHSLPGRPNVVFINQEAPHEKNEDFRRTVRMHVMRDYRRRMRELAAPGGAVVKTTSPRAKSPNSSPRPRSRQHSPRSTSTAQSNTSFPVGTPRSSSQLAVPSSNYAPDLNPEFVPSSDDGELDFNNWSLPANPSQQDISIHGYLSMLNCNYGFVPVISPAPSSVGSPGGSPTREHGYTTDPWASLPAHPPGYQELFHHFDTVCSSKIPFYNADLSPIKTRLVPLVNSCTATLYALLAVSATHLAGDSDSKIQIRALSYRQKAIIFLNQDLETVVSTPVQHEQRQWAMDRAIFTACLIGWSYYIDSGTADWDMRMAGITHLVSSSGGPVMLGFDGILKQLFSWHDIFGSSLTFTAPLTPGTYWTPSPEALSAGIQPTYHITGCPDEIMSMIGEMAAIAAAMRTAAIDVHTPAQSLEARLYAWNPSHELPPVVGSQAEWEQGWSIYQHAALLYLYTVVLRLPNSEPVVEKTAEELLGRLKVVAAGNVEVEKSLLWCYFLTGTVLEGPEGQKWIQDRMACMSELTRIRAWASAGTTLVGMWEARMGLWETVLQAEKRGVAFLYM